ncbi:MAG TPA: hypothetical protein VHQ90_12625 [Thermoanaerobaculia bacterium]|nr:hypothetical protein [Thermoanaerobaculia bacterium]
MHVKAAHPVKRLEDLSNMQLVTLTLFALGGNHHKVDTEDIAIRASQLAPGRFSWTKYPQQISLEHVRVYLSDAKKKGPGGGLIVGSGTKGWSLTAAGVAWASRHEDLLARVAEPHRRQDHAMQRRIRLETARISELPAWEKYLEGAPVSLREAEAVFRSNPYASKERRHELVERMKTLFFRNADLLPFLEVMGQAVLQRSGVPT